MRENRHRDHSSDFRPWKLRRANGIAYLEYFEWQGFRCLFSTRVGGVSSPPFDSLNLSYSINDDTDAVNENLERFRAAVGALRCPIVRARQVHSDQVNVITSFADGLVGDALITDSKNVCLAVSVADCLPIFICDPSNQAFGVVHAGWKGTLKGITGACVERMQTEFGSDPGNMSALLGPAIGPCCFEVSSEVAHRFEELLPESVSGSHVNLHKANKLALEGLGVSSVASDPICTSCNQELFFSHRRDKGATGRMLALIGTQISEL
jgi:YfiH family protein